MLTTHTVSITCDLEDTTFSLEFQISYRNEQRPHLQDNTFMEPIFQPHVGNH